MNRWLHLLPLVSLLWLAGCAVEGVDEASDPAEQCDEPAVAAAAEALSAIDCGQHTDTGYSSGNPFPITVVTVDGKPVEMATANAYYVMAQAAAAAGVNLKIVSGFRTMAEQQYLYSCYVSCSCNSCNLAAKPGYSNHQSGHALDLNTSSPGVLDWLNAHGAAFGFKRTVPSEAWHWEWWGGGPGGGPCGTCTPHCEGSKIVGQDCGVGDCGVYGATCVDDAKGVRCSSVFCPALGQKKVCVNEQLIGDCNDGAISTGDCSVFGAVCVDDAKGARCAVVFCADRPAEAHDVCLPTGQLGHCTDVGGLSVEDCPATEPCTTTPGGAQCGAPAPAAPPDEPGDGSGGGGSSPDEGPVGGAAGAASTGTGPWGSGGNTTIAPSAGESPESSSEPVSGGCACALPGTPPGSGRGDDGLAGLLAGLAWLLGSRRGRAQKRVPSAAAAPPRSGATCNRHAVVGARSAFGSPK